MFDENKTLDLETAEHEFERFVECMDLDVDTTYMSEDDKSNLLKAKNRLIKALQKGALVINENGEAVYTPQNEKSLYKDAITFRERTGAALMAADRGRKGHDVAKTYAVMADMCGVAPKVFSGLVGIDGKTCEAIFLLLMD